jgi:DMSO/TMAO reductase YedYZ heme-binding membrane subunit
MASKQRELTDRLARALVYVGYIAIGAVAVLIITMIAAQSREAPPPPEVTA